MGKINKGILGGFSGKVGNVVGANWKGIDYMRIKAANVANPRTEAQVNQRTKFILVLRFLSPLKDFLKEGFKQYAIKMTEFNNAMSYNLKNAVNGNYPDYSLDYSNLLVSRGDLTGAMNGSATSDTPEVVTFSWDDNTGNGSARSTDQSMLLLYNEDKGEALYITEGPVRDMGTATMQVPANYSGDTLQAFLSFITEDRKEVADSKYLGTVVVA